jgi:hypothetical protein
MPIFEKIFQEIIKIENNTISKKKQLSKMFLFINYFTPSIFSNRDDLTWQKHIKYKYFILNNFLSIGDNFINNKEDILRIFSNTQTHIMALYRFKEICMLKTKKYLDEPQDLQFNLLNKLSYVICVLSDPGSGDQLAKIALDLGICVPVITYGSGNDIRDQLGLIRITIPAEKEIVHLLMPEQDSDSIIKLLVEHGRLDRPGKGFIYETPVTHGLIDTQMKIGNQKYAASMEQIIAAIDQLKTDTNWRKRLDADSANLKIGKSMRPQDNCEVSIISDEDRIDILRETCLDIGAAGAITSQIIPHKDKDGFATNLIKSAISVPALITDNVVDRLLSISTINDEDVDRIQVLDSPAAYVRSL